MQLIKFLALTIAMLCISMIVRLDVAFAECPNEIDEEFEARGYKDWVIEEDGGEVSTGPGYKGQGVVITRSSPGGDQFTRLERQLPPTWVGKTIKVEVMVKYDNIKPGRKFYHAGHIDYEAFTETGPVYPHWGRFTGTQSDWKLWSDEWQIPPNAETTVFRIGLQGASGTIYFDNLKIYLCE